MSVFCCTIVECWDHDPEARLTAHCVVERLTALRQEGEELRPEVCRDGDEQRDKDSPDNEQIQSSSSSSSLLVPQTNRGDTEVSHDSLV